MKKKITILFLAIVFVPFGKTFAQSPLSFDSTWHGKQIQNALVVEQGEFSGPNMLVYQGYEYVPYFLPVGGTPFFLSKQWQSGSVRYEGIWYQGLSLMYDLFKDQLIVQSPDKMYRIALTTNQVTAFKIAGHEFIRLQRNDSMHTGNPGRGYYELLFKGKDSLLAKRTKIVNVPTEPGMSRNYRQVDAYYIKKEGVYFPVKSKNSVLRVLSDQKPALKKFIRRAHINYREGREEPILTLLRYYDKISE